MAETGSHKPKRDTQRNGQLVETGAPLFDEKQLGKVVWGTYRIKLLAHIKLEAQPHKEFRNTWRIVPVRRTNYSRFKPQ